MRGIDINGPGYRLIVAEILYHPAERPHATQSFTWQDYDIAPDYPELHRFLSFWLRRIGGQLQSVRVESLKLVTTPGPICTVSSTAIH